MAPPRPPKEKPPQVKAERIEKDHWVVLRGVYLQDRVGTFGETQLSEPTPVLFAQQWRIVLPPDQSNPLISTLDDALWSEVGDRYMAESRNWEEDAVYEVIQWARAQGHEAIAEKLRNGELPWESWGSDRFNKWRKEVAVDADAERPLTEGSRGKIYRISGIVGEVLQFGWERIPRNPWGVDEFQIPRILADHYQTVAFQSILRPRSWALPLVPRADELTMPTSILWGMNDQLLNILHSHHLNLRLLYGDMILFPEAAHSPHAEAPDQFHDAMRQILQQDGGR